MRDTEPSLLDARVNALAARYRRIASTRMQGTGLLNPHLAVQTVGFEALEAVASPDAPAAALGILLTPWFMNLVWLPLQPHHAPDAVGRKVARQVGAACFEFIAAHEEGLGNYESCSLFSPVFEFDRQQTALDTAQAVLQALRQPVPTPTPSAVAHAAPVAQVPARRAFLFGRSGAPAVPAGQRPQGERHG